MVKNKIENDNNILIKTSDNKIFKIKRKYALISKLIENICILDKNSGSINNEIYFKNIDSNYMKIIIEYMNYMQGIDYFNYDENLNYLEINEILTKEDIDFLNYIFKNKNINVNDFLNIVNYLSMEGFLNKLCIKFSFNIKTKNYTEIYEYLSNLSVN